jgi:acetylornithine/succinyldiaminopimelate/putrescine aminotransferase
MHDWGDMLVQAGFAEPVMDMERITLTYADADNLLAECRLLGRNLHRERFAGLRGKRWLAQLKAALLTLAKPLAGGLPMGAILVTDDVARTIQPGDHGTTFGGGPLLAHVAHHVVQRLADPALLAHVRETGVWFGEQLQAMSERTGRIRAIRGTGLMWGVDVHEPAAAIIGRAFDRGLLMVSAGEHTLRFLPPLVISRDELAAGLAVLEAALVA